MPSTRERPSTHPPAGIPQFREIIADYAGRLRGLKIDPAQVVVGCGSKPGLFFPTLALVAPGDEVIYPDPGFPTYEAMIRVAGGIPVPVPLLEENQFSFDLDIFDDKISDRTKLIVLNSPGNPTGGVIPFEDLKHIAEKAREHNCWVLSDEIYTQLVYDGGSAHSIAEVDGMLERTVIVDGFSKTYSMTGWRLGYMITPAALGRAAGTAYHARHRLHRGFHPICRDGSPDRSAGFRGKNGDGIPGAAATGCWNWSTPSPGCTRRNPKEPFTFSRMSNRTE